MSIRVAKPLAVETTEIDGVWRLHWSPMVDERGSVQPVYVASHVAESPLPRFSVVQTNLSRSTRGVVRGIHGEQIHKMIAVLRGRVYAVAVDLRSESLTFGRHVGFELGPEEGMFLSPGVGNGFLSLSQEPTFYLYMFDQEWRPGMPGVHVNALDPELGIDWPIRDGVVQSEKDRTLPALASVRTA